MPAESPRGPEPLALAKASALLPGEEVAGLPPGHRRASTDTCPAQGAHPPAPPRPGALSSGESDGGGPTQDGAVLDAERGTPALQLDTSVLLDDDSNQPMPVSRFFGNVELMQVRPLSCPGGGPQQSTRWVITPWTACGCCLSAEQTRGLTREELNPGGGNRAVAGWGVSTRTRTHTHSPG